MKYKTGDKIVLITDDDDLENEEIPCRYSGETVTITKTDTNDGTEWYRFDNDVGPEDMNEENYEDDVFWVSEKNIQRLAVINNWKQHIGGK